MSPTRIEQKLQPIELDLTAAFSFEHGFGRSQLLEVAPQLESVRQGLVSAAPVDGPRRLLDEYRRSRRESLIGQILSHAKRLRELVDTVVIPGPGRLVAATSALLSACGHPQHNQLSRGGRGGRPRIHFAPATPDNDSIQGLLDILPRDRMLQNIEERWGLVVLDSLTGFNVDEQSLLSGLFLLFWEALQTTTNAHEEKSLAIAAVPSGSALHELADGIEIGKVTFSVESNSMDFISPGVLLAGSIVGLDIVALVRGAAAMSERFVAMPVGDNPALDFAGLCQLLVQRRGIFGRMVDSGGEALEPLARWFDRHPSAVDGLLVQWLPQSVRTDRLRVTMPADRDDTDRKRRKERYLTEIAGDDAQRARQARIAAGQPTVIVRLPCVNESSVGQLIQLHTIATDVEKLLNPEP